MVYFCSADLNVNHTYYGVLIQNGWSEGAMFELSGQIYAVDHETIQIIGFSFSGLAKGKLMSCLHSE